MDDTFYILAAKVLAGEASPEERSRFEFLLRSDAGLRNEFDTLRSTENLVREAAPVLGALSASPASLPAHREQELARKLEYAFPRESEPGRQSPQSRQSPRQQPIAFALRKWAWFMPAAIAIVALFIFLRPKDPARRQTNTVVAYSILHQGSGELSLTGESVPIGPVATLLSSQRLTLQPHTRVTLITPDGLTMLDGPLEMGLDEAALQRLSFSNYPAVTQQQSLINQALFSPLTNLNSLLAVSRAAGGFPVYSPLGATASLTPLLDWKSETNKVYELVLTDEFDPAVSPWRAHAVAPPLQFTNVFTRALKADNLYRLQITERGKPIATATVTFRTTVDARVARARSAADQLIATVEAIAKGRLGDALSDLHSLPEPMATSELGIRLRAAALAQAGYHEDLDALLAHERNKVRWTDSKQ